MHLVIVSLFPPTITGIGQYGYHVTCALAKSGAFSRVTVLAGSHVNGITPNHLGITELDYCWQPGQWNARAVILSRVKRLNPDLIWFNLGVSMFGKSPWINVSGLLVPMLAKRMGYPTVVTLHELMELSDLRALDAPGGAFAPMGARWLTDVATQADVICLTRKHYVTWLTKRMIDCTYIPHGAFHEPNILDENSLAELLIFNSMAPFKGVELLLEAFPALQKKEYPHLKLTIAGAEHPRFPGYTQSIKDRFAGMEGIRWLGEVPDQAVIELFRRAKLIVLPYTASTGSSSVLYRAAAWGRAVVASDLSEMRSLAQEENFQVEFFENGNAVSLQNAIRSLLVSPEKRRAQIQNNFQVIQNARIEITCQRYLHAFNRALEKRKSLKRLPIPYIEIESV
jgi:glycosyltransferase involved in cell wall biosynthesis